MAWWLVYEQCPACTEPDCLQCHRADRRLTLRAVQAEEMPRNSLNGPCLTPAEMLHRMGEFFTFDPETGLMHFKVSP